jgi:hypothetical protein
MHTYAMLLQWLCALNHTLMHADHVLVLRALFATMRCILGSNWVKLATEAAAAAAAAAAPKLATATDASTFFNAEGHKRV